MMMMKELVILGLLVILVVVAVAMMMLSVVSVVPVVVVVQVMMILLIVVITVARIVTACRMVCLRKVIVVKSRLNHIELHVSSADPSVVVGWIDRKGRRHLQVWR